MTRGASTTELAEASGEVVLPTPPLRSLDSLALSSFVVLGLPDGMVGPAWPVLRQGFGAPLADLGLFLVAGTVGSLASSASSGVLLSRVGVRGAVMVAAGAGLAGAGGAAASPDLWAFVVSGVGLGLAAGLLDGSLNTVVALAGRNRLLNLLHGSYGAGTTLAPLVVTAAVLAGEWRIAYWFLAAVEAALLAAWWWAGKPSPPTTRSPNPSAEPRTWEGRAPRSAASFVPLIAIGLAVFMAYVGLEVGAGQWGPSFERGVLHLSTTSTGLVTFGYWGALTAGRFALAVPRQPFPPAAVARWGCVAALAGAALVWWRPSVAAALAGLIVVGGACAGVFPALVALTPSRVGEDMAKHVIGWQVGAAAVGGTAISAAFGAAFEHWGLRYFGLALVVVGALLVAGVLLLERAPSWGGR